MGFDITKDDWSDAVPRAFGVEDKLACLSLDGTWNSSKDRYECEVKLMWHPYDGCRQTVQLASFSAASLEEATRLLEVAHETVLAAA